MTNMEAGGSWIGMKTIISAYMQYYFCQPSEQSSAGSRRRGLGGKTGGKIPSPYSLENVQDTYLRCAMLLALSSIRARSGITPYDVASLLLTQAENVYTDSSAAADSDVSYDEAHICCVLMIALSRVKVSTYMTAPRLVSFSEYAL